MSKKIWIIVSCILICGFLLIGMAGCGKKETSEENKNDDTTVSKLIEDFAKYMNNKEIEKVVDLIDIEEYGKIVNQIDKDQLEEILTEMNIESYEVTNIKRASEEEIENVMQAYGDYENYTDLYKDYVKYAVDYKMNMNGNIIEAKDIFFIKEENGSYSLVISKVWQGYISHMYIMNNEAVETE